MTTPPTKLTQQYWSEVLADWGDSRLPPPQFDELRAVLDYWLDCADQAEISLAALLAVQDNAGRADWDAACRSAHAAANAAARLAYFSAFDAAYAAWREPDAVSP